MRRTGIALAGVLPVTGRSGRPASTSCPWPIHGLDHGGVALSETLASAAEDIRLAREGAEVVIVFMHRGVEREPCPTQVPRTAQAYAGAAPSSTALTGDAPVSGLAGPLGVG